MSVTDYMRLRGEGESKYKISLVGLALILGGAMVVGYYLLSEPEENVTLIARIGSIAMLLMILGIPQGVNISLKLDHKALFYGIMGFGLLLVIRFFMGFTLSITGWVVLYLSAVFEELGFRFGLQRFLERFMGVAGIVVQAGVFMVYHWMVYPGYELVSLFPFLGGLVLGTIYYLSKDLSAPLLAHVLNNLV